MGERGRERSLPGAVRTRYAVEKVHARELLEKKHGWWLNALGERYQKSSKDSAIEPLFFRIQIVSMTGLYAPAEGG